MTRCGFEPDGRPCPNPATVMVTLTGYGLPVHDVATCAEHVHDWVDHVAATARPITPEPTPEASSN